MKIELMLSNTYVCQGKVYNKVDSAGKSIVYEVSKAVGKHLLAQNNERNVFYFRRASDDGALAHLAPKKSINKGGVPIPVEDEVVDAVAAEAEAEIASGGGVTQVEDPDDDDDDDAPKLDADGQPVDDDEAEEAVTV